MTNAEFKKDWLNWFKLAVANSTTTRLSGDTEAALRWDQLVKRYYNEPNDYYTTDQLVLAEETAREYAAMQYARAELSE